MAEPTIDVVALIDEDLIYNRICKEWDSESRKALQEVADRLEQKYFYKIEFYGSDGVFDISPTKELERTRK